MARRENLMQSPALRHVAVSVIVPTLNRPTLVVRAVDSIRQQTCPPAEIIVVIDGPDPATREALQSMSCPSLRIIQNDASIGAADARNKGVQAATSEWVAFLDDDDEWLPTKLERQIALAETGAFTFVTCISRVMTPRGTFFWPETPYDNGEPFADYLFDRRSVFAGAAFLQTSSFLIQRSRFEREPFQPGPHDDWSFTLRQLAPGQGGLGTVPEPLVVHYIDERRKSLSSSSTWKTSLAWAQESRSCMTGRAYSGFCLCVVGARAAGEGAWAAFFPLLREAVVNGTPRLRHVVAFLAFWLVPASLRRSIRARLRAVPSGGLGEVTS
jgi:glycosyltransferase involved in cell wall biosynthesis